MSDGHNHSRGDVRKFQLLNILPTILICKSLVGYYRLQAHFKQGLLVTPQPITAFHHERF